ncbi:MAG: hypothetical protein VX460_01275 [Planctomycetota bacterium]|nr:hypothetical protein [Planctomycetota bacterium]
MEITVSALHVLAILTALHCAACHAAPVDTDPRSATPIRVAHLGAGGGDAEGFEALRRDFKRRNPGYDVEWHDALDGLEAVERHVVAFVQSGSSAARVIDRGSWWAGTDPVLTTGDVVLLRPGEHLSAEGPLSAVVFTVPEPFPRDLPTFVRPDWDERITDTPGGCAEETGAYRRILLTWLETVGPYVYRALNCHRVRITDSFSHYHPLKGGFDEFYLVQMAQPGAVLYTSDGTARIEDPAAVTRAEAPRLFEKHPLEVGDLVYLPRGTIHRGFGGVLAQIITAPGFRPGAEIGVDHHLRAINERLGLAGADALPYREASASRAVVK